MLTSRERKIGDKRVVLAQAAPPIISHEVAATVAERLAANKEASERNSKHPEVALLRGGFAKCGLCKGNLVVTYVGSKESRTHVYRCGRSRRAGSGTQTCEGVTIVVRKLDDAVWGKVLVALRDPDYLEAEARKRVASGGNRDAITALQHRMKRLEQDQLNIRKAIRRLEDDAGDAAVEDILAGLLADARQAAQDKLDAQEEVAALERQQHDWERVQQRLQNARVWCQAVSEAHGTLTYDERRTVLFGLGTKAVVNAADQKPRATLKIGEQDIELLSEEDAQNGAIVSLSSCPLASPAP